MSYRCTNAADYENKPVKGNGQCAVLVEMLAGAPRAEFWKKGVGVRGATILPGTAIATFDASGKYPNKSTGNHAALYMKQDGHGIEVIEQYKGLEFIKRRKIRFMNGKPAYHNNLANDADGYSVIE